MKVPPFDSTCDYKSICGIFVAGFDHSSMESRRKSVMLD